MRGRINRGGRAGKQGFRKQNQGFSDRRQITGRGGKNNNFRRDDNKSFIPKRKEPKQFVKKNFRRKKLTKENLDKDMDKYWKGKKEVDPDQLKELDNDLDDYFKNRGSSEVNEDKKD